MKQFYMMVHNLELVLSQVRASPQCTMEATINWIVLNEFEHLLLTRQTGGLTRVGQPLFMRARIPVQWQ